MAVLSLPLTFQNSFWSQDYKSGLEVLYAQLENGVLENEEIIAFIRARAAAESGIASSLSSAARPGKAFAHDEGASMHVAFRGLKEELNAEGEAHEAISKELYDAVATPFEKWALGYKDRLRGSKHNMLDGWIYAYESAQSEVAKLKNDYLAKTRRADEAEDDARFAPIHPPVGDKYTTSPSMQPRDKRLPTRTPTMTERLSQRFKELRIAASTASQEDGKPAEVHFDADVDGTEKGSEQGTPRIDKGKGRALPEVASPPRMASPPPMSPPLPPAAMSTNVNSLSPPPIQVAGALFDAAVLSELFKRARHEMSLRAVRFPLLGEYQDCFSGEEFVVWLKDSVKEFNGNLDRAAYAARELTEKMNLLRRVGQLGNDFENLTDAYYQFRPQAFTLAEPVEKSDQVISPINLAPLAENVAKRTTTFASLVSKALNANGTNEAAHIRARRDADVADREYRIAVRKLDRQRLGLEERIEETLKTLQKWETDRLRAVKTVLRQYQDATAKLAGVYPPSLERITTLIDSYQPEADLKVFIERYRTGPFRPEPQVYESVSHDECDVVFGIDLRRWAESEPVQGEGSEQKKEDVPPVLTLMLSSLGEAYGRLPNDLEKRRTWIYDVPLSTVHHVRESLNAIPLGQPYPADILVKYDAPVLAGAVKLWALELDPPLGLYEGWDEMRKLYPTVGSAASEETFSEQQHILELQAGLQRLPTVHLTVLDTIVCHLKELIASTSEAENEEANEVYITKLALSMGRTILRPRQETERTIQDRHPTLLFMDLINKYEQIIPPTLERKKRESQRKVPVRRRTRPVDMRMSRSRISAGADIKELQSQQFQQRTGMKFRGRSPPLPNPPPINVPDSPDPMSGDGSDPAVMRSAEPIEAPTITFPPPPAAGDTYSGDNRSSPPEAPPQETNPEPAVVPLASVKKPDISPHPAFKEPPPEVDDLPPHPVFREPPPESDSPDESLPMPSFAPPPPEPQPEIPIPSFKEPPTETPASPPGVAVLRGEGSRPVSPRVPAYDSRSPSPSKPLTPSTPTPTNTSPTDSGSGRRGARLARVPRAGGGSVSSMVSNINRQSLVGSNSRPSSPGLGIGGASGGGLTRASSRTIGAGHGKRGSISRVSEFSRRTMASDAEDEVVDK